MNRFAALLLVTILHLSSAKPALAQTTLAVTGGVNLATFATETVEDDFGLRSITRLSIGLAVTRPMSERLGLRLGGGYSQRGTSIELADPIPGVDVEGGIRIDYLELSLLGTARVFGAGDGLALHLLAGPVVATRTSCQTDFKVTFAGETEDETEDCADDTSSGDFGVAGGGALEIGLSDRLGLSLSAIYSWGLREIFLDSDDDTAKHRILSVRAGLVFPIG